MSETALSRERALSEIVVAPRTDPIYNCHTYLTKVPIGAIQPFIELSPIQVRSSPTASPVQG